MQGRYDSSILDIKSFQDFMTSCTVQKLVPQATRVCVCKWQSSRCQDINLPGCILIAKLHILASLPGETIFLGTLLHISP